MIDVHTQHDDLAAKLAAAGPRRWWNKATVCLGAAVLLVGGFVAGAQVQREYGQPASPVANRPTGAAGAGAFAGRFGGANPGGTNTSGTNTGDADTGGTTPASATTGKVKLIDGTTVYVETSSGDVITVRTDAQTKVEAAAPSALKDLKAGDTVTVQGRSGGEDTVIASTVTATR